MVNKPNTKVSNLFRVFPLWNSSMYSYSQLYSRETDLIQIIKFNQLVLKSLIRVVYYFFI